VKSLTKIVNLLTKTKPDMKKITKLFLAVGMFIVAAGLILSSCTKEGPQGASGTNGKDGTNGADANETCKQCHSPSMVDKVATEFELAKHSWGTVAFEEAGNTGCTPCHASKAYIYMCKNNVPSTFTFTGGKWVNNYATDDADAIGAINCWTCHSSLHTTYGVADLAFTSTAPVSMTMWGGAKTIDLPADSGVSNLCVKCHQPRPLTCGNDPAGRLLNYDSLVSSPNTLMYDSTAGAHNIYAKPSYRMHIHYGAIGAIYAGVGGIEFPGLSYSNSPHSTIAACPDCHMAEPMTGMAGGHAFNVRNAKESALGSGTTWNFNGCNKTGCHSESPITTTSSKWATTRSDVKTKLDALATAINAAGGGHDILHKDASSTNLWWGISTGNYDGYLDIYTPGTNDAGYWRDPYSSNSTNLTKPKFPSLTFAQTGALINFQLCLREYSLGIHNTQYVKALLDNSIAALNPGSFTKTVALKKTGH
jgi:hypothetical protein